MANLSISEGENCQKPGLKTFFNRHFPRFLTQKNQIIFWATLGFFLGTHRVHFGFTQASYKPGPPEEMGEKKAISLIPNFLVSFVRREFFPLHLIDSILICKANWFK